MLRNKIITLAQNGDLEQIKLLGEKHYDRRYIYKRIFIAAVECGNMDVIKYFEDKYFNKEGGIYMAIDLDRVDILKEIFKDTEIEYECWYYYYAAKKGKFESFKFLFDLMFMRVEKCRNYEFGMDETCNIAKEYKNFKCLNYALEHGAVMDGCTPAFFK